MTQMDIDPLDGTEDGRVTFEVALHVDGALVEQVGEKFVSDVLATKMDEALVLIQKQAAYGPDNIGRPPHGISPEVALVVRSNDKMQRLGTLLSSGNAQPPGSESRLDSWGDLANYGSIGTMVETGRWPGLRR